MAKAESIGVNKVKIEVAVSAQDFAEALQQAYIKNRGKFNVQGFRKGKAPKPVIESYYGEGVFFEDAFDILFPGSYEKAIEELKLEPVSRPDLDITTIDKKEGVVYTAEIFVKPEVKLGQYKGVKAQKTEAKVDEAEVEAELQKLADRNARWVDVDREAKDKDKVVIDYSGSVDDVKFEGGTAENQVLELGSKMFIPGFEEQIVGMKKGDEKDITVTFPEDYRAENLAGKEAVFHIVLRDVKEKELPKIDDEFAQDVSEFDTIAEYKESIKIRLMERAQQQADAQTRNSVIDEVVKNAQVDIPECMVDTQIDYQIRQVEYSLSYQGVSLQDYLNMTGETMENVRAEYKEPAEKTVKRQLVIEAVKDAEGIKAEDEQIENELKTRAERAKKEFDEYRKSVSDDELEYIADDIAYENAIKFLVDSAIFDNAKKIKKETLEKENKKTE